LLFTRHFILQSDNIQVTLSTFSIPAVPLSLTVRAYALNGDRQLNARTTRELLSSQVLLSCDRASQQISL